MSRNDINQGIEPEGFVRWLRKANRWRYKQLLKRYKQVQVMLRPVNWEEDYWNAIDRLHYCTRLMRMNGQIKPGDLEGRAAANAYWVHAGLLQLADARETRIRHPRRIP